jgi:DNA-binding HxlR family transcriptional regulator
MDFSEFDPALQKGLTQLASDMREHGYQREEPVRDIFGMLGDRWTTLLMLVLHIGTIHHAELRRIIGRLSEGAEGRISQRILTAKLRALERNGLVIRQVSKDVPPRVAYELSENGRSLVVQTGHLMKWIQQHRSDIEAARRQFDAQLNDE